VRSVELLTQVEAGGEPQVTPAHGSPLQTPPVHPNVHAVEVCV
jgi:hypothetical protein